jgi:ribosomal protein S8
MKNYTFITNSYNIAVKKKSLNIKFRVTRNNLRLLKKFKSLGIVNSYLYDKTKNLAKMSPTYFNNTPYSSSVKLISRDAKAFSISLKGLNLLKKFSGESIIIIETPKGILTLEESLYKKSTGKILAILS